MPGNEPQFGTMKMAITPDRRCNCEPDSRSRSAGGWRRCAFARMNSMGQFDSDPRPELFPIP